MSSIRLSKLDAELEPHLDAPAWFIGISGGVDSSVLLHLLVRWIERHPGSPSLQALHVNHQLQASASDFESHCQAQCAALHVPLQSLRVDVPLRSSPEAAAREARYQAFEAALPAGAVLFLAHHQDDQVETFFLRLMRGAGVDGLSAMPAARPLGDAVVARPLLSIPRGAIEDYARDHSRGGAQGDSQVDAQLTYIEDPTNKDTTLDRNFLRAQVLPLLETRWPGYRKTVSRASDNLATASASLRAAQGSVLTVKNSMGDPGVSQEDLVQAGGAARLRYWLQALNLQLPDASMLEEFLRQLRESTSDAAPRLDTGAYQLQRFRDVVYLLPQPESDTGRGSFELFAGQICDVPDVGRLSLQRSSAEGFVLALGENAEIVWRSGGEECRLAQSLDVDGNVSGKRTTLKKLLQSRGIPAWWRERVPLILVDSELVAVGDLALCQSSRWRAQAEGENPVWRVRWERGENPPQSGVGD